MLMFGAARPRSRAAEQNNEAGARESGGEEVEEEEAARLSGPLGAADLEEVEEGVLGLVWRSDPCF